MSSLTVRESSAVPTVPVERSAAPPASRESSVVPATGASPFARLVRGLGHEVQTGESLVRAAVTSPTAGALDPAELIALQAGIYRYAEVVDLAARLVDHATTGLKTVLQGQ